VKENGASGREAARCLTGGGRFPPGPPSDIVKRLNDAANKVLTSSTTIEQIAAGWRKSDAGGAKIH
jgi:hypothetical protein